MGKVDYSYDYSYDYDYEHVHVHEAGKGRRVVRMKPRITENDDGHT